MQFIYWVALFVGLAGILYTVYGLVRLNDYFYEVYAYDRDPYS